MEQDKYLDLKMQEIATFCHEVEKNEKIREFLFFMRKKYGQGKLFPEMKKIFIRKEIIPIASHLGYYFTVDEFLLYESKVQNLYNNKHKLKDSDLADVNAGLGFAISKTNLVLNEIFRNSSLEENFFTTELFAGNKRKLYKEDDDLSSTRIKENGVVYDIDLINMTATVVRCSSDAPSSIVIPKVLQNKFLVTRINSMAFICKDIQSVSLPDSLVSVGDNAFESCFYLKRVTGGESITSIGVSAFENCKNLYEFEAFGKVTHINECVFKNCRALDNISLSEHIEYIARSAFQNCISLEHVNLSKQNSSYAYQEGIGVGSVCDLFDIVISANKSNFTYKQEVANNVYLKFEKFKKEFFKTGCRHTYNDFISFVSKYIKKEACAYLPHKLVDQNLFDSESTKQRILYLKVDSKNYSKQFKHEVLGTIVNMSGHFGNYASENFNYIKKSCGPKDSVIQMYFLPDAKTISQYYIDDIKYIIEKYHSNEGYVSKYEEIFNRHQKVEQRINAHLLNNDILIALMLGYDAIVLSDDDFAFDRGDGTHEQLLINGSIILKRDKVVVCEKDK